MKFLSGKVLNDISMRFVIFFIVIFIGYFVKKFDIQILLIPIQIVFYYFAINLISNILSNTIIFLYKKRHKLEKEKDNFILGVKNVFFFLSNIIFIFIFLTTIGIDVFSIFTSLSIIAAAIVIMLREFLANFFNGINLMFSRDLNLGDYIKIGESKGRITEIKFQNIELKTESGDFVYIPNNLVQSKEIINYSKEDAKKISFDIIVEKTNYKKVLEIKADIINSILKKYKEIVIDEEKVNVRILKIDKDFITLNIEVHPQKFSHELDLELKDYINERVIKLLK